MTVAEIKDFIDKQTTDIANTKSEHLQVLELATTLSMVDDMLDELEPKDNTSQWTQHYEICGYVCDNCGHISEIKDDVCSNCGARMNDELKENNK